MRISKLAGALSLTSVLSLGVVAPATSAPITPLSASARPAAPASEAIQVRFGGFHGGFGGFRGGFGGWHGGGWGWRGGGWGWRRGGWGVGLGALAAGAVIGSALAAPYYYGAPYYDYDDDYTYAYPYGYTRVVVAPGYWSGWGGNPYWRRPWRGAYGFAVGW